MCMCVCAAFADWCQMGSGFAGLSVCFQFGSWWVSLDGAHKTSVSEMRPAIFAVGLESTGMVRVCWGLLTFKPSGLFFP